MHLAGQEYLTYAVIIYLFFVLKNGLLYGTVSSSRMASWITSYRLS